MKALDRGELLENLASYGYTLMKPVSTSEPEVVLENLLKQDDVRLLEGFPVVLGYTLREKESFGWENSKWYPEKELPRKSEQRLSYFLALSYLLFELFGLDKPLVSRTMKLLSKCENGKVLLAKLEKPFARSETVKLDDLELSTERLKNNFRNYVVHAPESREAQLRKQSLEFELLLSEVFTPRQKTLLRKRLEKKPFTKTEREYYSRVVKKRLRALASDELHQLAHRLLHD